jgi:hypothetical protein
MNEQKVKGLDHWESEMRVAYMICLYSAGKRKAIDDHYLDSRQCRIELAMLERLQLTPTDDDELRDLASLLPYGQRAAAQARQIIKQQEKRRRWFPLTWSVLVRNVRSFTQ